MPADADEIAKLVRAFETLTLAHADWTHPAHLTVATHYAAADPETALDMMRSGIKAFNASHGIEMTETGGYHETLTVVWMHLIRAHLATLPGDMPLAEKVDAIIEAFSDKKVILEYYSRDRIMSREARWGWVGPDLKRLPPLE